MPAYREDNGTWTSKFKYRDWRGEKKQKTKRGFERKKDAFGQKPINQITELDVLNWQTWVQQKGFDKFKGVGYAPTYLKSINNELSAMMNYAVRYYRLPYNPCERAGSMGKSSAETMEIWTLDQFEQFIGYADKSDARTICMVFMVLSEQTDYLHLQSHSC